MKSLIIVLVLVFIVAPLVFIVFISLIDRIDNGPEPNKTKQTYHCDDDGGSSSFHYSSQTDWERFTDSERYSGHSYGDSVSHTVDEGRTYGYNEKW